MVSHINKYYYLQYHNLRANKIKKQIFKFFKYYIHYCYFLQILVQESPTAHVTIFATILVRLVLFYYMLNDMSLLYTIPNNTINSLSSFLNNLYIK